MIDRLRKSVVACAAAAGCVALSAAPAQGITLPPLPFGSFGGLGIGNLQAPPAPPLATDTATATTPAALDVGSGLLVFQNEATAWVAQHPGDPRTPSIQNRIASKSTALWLVDSPYDQQNLQEAVQQANAQNATLPLVLYNIPGRDDGLSGPQGAGNAAAYKSWIDRISAALGNTRAAVTVEPDALWFVDRQTPSGAAYNTRMSSLKYAVDTLSARNPGARIYVDAGTSSGSVTPQRMADLLAQVDVSNKVGYAVNIGSYAPEPAITVYAQAIRAALQSRHAISDPRYIVDTGRNGNPVWNFTWCNPAGRRLGFPPGVVNSPDGRDMNLWVKGPGTSDGNCGTGLGTSGGQFVPNMAMQLIG